MRRLAAAAAVVALVVGVAAPAWAHATLLSVDPRSGSTVDVRPQAVTLRFSESVDPPAAVAVTGPSGQQVGVGAAAVLGERVSQRLLGADTGPGEYVVRYQVLSSDGHVVTGTTDFTVSGRAGPGVPGDAGSAARPSVLVTALLLLMLLLLAVAGISRLTRSVRA